VKGRHLRDRGQAAEAEAAFATALRLDPNSYEANMGAGRHAYRVGRFADACRLFATAEDLSDEDFDSVALLISACAAKGDPDGMRQAARRTLERAERALTRDNGDVAATSYGAYALAALGEGERAKAWIDQALLIDPSNLSMRYNMACAVCVYLADADLALSVLTPFFATATERFLAYAESDPDLAPVREDPRFTAFIEEARRRIAAEGE
jgi:adenylate cyclase